MNGKSLLLEKAGGDKGVAASLLSQMFILSTPAHLHLLPTHLQQSSAQSQLLLPLPRLNRTVGKASCELGVCADA